MVAALYSELVPWYRLVDPPEDHAEEAGGYRVALERAIGFHPQTLLELGAGAGHNAVHLKDRFRCTLTDPSSEMQALSRDLNPECEHLAGDMRTVRLDRIFDAVLVHDAVMYMLTEEDLLAAARTAFEHTRPGGVAVFAPDVMRDTFEESSALLESHDDARALRGVAWQWDPDPSDTTFVTDYAFILRDGSGVRVVHDRHVEGLFAKEDWIRILGVAGFGVEVITREDEGNDDEIFLCRRPPPP